MSVATLHPRPHPLRAALDLLVDAIEHPPASSISRTGEPTLGEVLVVASLLLDCPGAGTFTPARMHELLDQYLEARCAGLADAPVIQFASPRSRL